jgi:hypothetical protein
MQVMTIEQIKMQYPDQWVLIGNPELRNPETNGLILNRFIRGTVLLANKDKRALAYQAKEVVAGYEETACIFTGEIARKRIFLL